MIFSAWYKIFSFKKILMMSDIAKKERIIKVVMIEDQSRSKYVQMSASHFLIYSKECL